MNEQPDCGSHVFRYYELYSLSEANDREHNQTSAPVHTHADRELKTHLSRGAAPQNYAARYHYDALGNLTERKHTVPAQSALTWTRTQAYDGDDIAC